VSIGILATVLTGVSNAESFGDRVKRAEDTFYEMDLRINQIDTMVGLMYFFLAEEYKKTHTLEEYYIAIFEANQETCVMCNQKLEGR
jgi:hypothetical protein